MKTLIALVAFQALFSIFLLVSKKKKEAFDRILVFFFGFIVFYFITKFGLVFIGENKLYYNLPTGYSFIYGPMLLLLTKRMLKQKLGKKTVAVHFLPFVAYTVYFIWVLFNLKSDENSFAVQLYKNLAYLELISMFGYALNSLISIRKYNKEEKPKQYKLVRLMSILLMSYSLLIVALVILHGVFQFKIDLRLSYVFVLIMVCSIVYYKLKQGDEKNEVKTTKYKNSGLSDSELNNYKIQLDNYLTSKRIYENPDLTLAELSKLTGIPAHHLSQLLNTKFNKNFYQYINEFRVRAVIKKIQHSKTNENIIDLAFSSGFNSKSSFNNYFKKVTGKTPSQFKKELV